MKYYSDKQRTRDVRRCIIDRKGKNSVRKNLTRELDNGSSATWRSVNSWVKDEMSKGLLIKDCDRLDNPPKNAIMIVLPERMNFNKEYDSTVQYVTAIRKLVKVLDLYKGRRVPSKAYKLGSVDFGRLRHISTSAALVLTAEISKWDHSIRKKLVPYVANWCPEIYDRFTQLGFFDLFENKPNRPTNCTDRPGFRFVRYLKAKVGDSVEAKRNKKYLKSEIAKIVGEDVSQWTILHSGLSEAVTNVTHHAYPNSKQFQDPSWYLTGSYDSNIGDMKIVFYDQGIGIPNSLPASKVWEKVLNYFSKLGIPQAEQRKHAELIKAAVSIDRTRTENNDRGKGLQDLLEFIIQRGSGHMSLMSYHGLYKYDVKPDQKPQIKTESFARPLRGTLIIWTVNLTNNVREL